MREKYLNRILALPVANLILELLRLDRVDVLDLLQVAGVSSGSENHPDSASVVLPGARHHAT